MTKKNIKNSPYVILENDSLQRAMEIITHNQRGSVVVVNKKWRVMGVLADGEIRRAIIKGATPNTPVIKILNVNFISISPYADKYIKNPNIILSNHPNINIIPVTDKDNKLIDIIIREYRL